MAGLKISICFWYLDTLVVDDVLLILKEGKIDVQPVIVRTVVY